MLLILGLFAQSPEYSAPSLKTIVAEGMTNKKRTSITIETQKMTVIRRRKVQTVAWCERCRAEVLMLNPDEVAALSGTTVREIFRQVESGELHSIETNAGTLLVCRGF